MHEKILRIKNLRNPNLFYNYKRKKEVNEAMRGQLISWLFCEQSSITALVARCTYVKVQKVNWENDLFTATLFLYSMQH